MRRWLAPLAAVVLAPALAHADDGAAKLLGWNARGDFIVKRGAELLQCVPTELPAAPSYEGAPITCFVCDGDGCKVAQPAAHLKSADVSPDGNITVATSRGCRRGHDYEPLCSSLINVDTAGSLQYTGIESSAAEPRLDVWFRADSRAVMLRMPTAFWAIDVSALDELRTTVVPQVTTLVTAHFTALRDGGDLLATADAQFYTDDGARGAIAPSELARVLGITADLAITRLVVTPAGSAKAAWIDLDASTATAAWHATDLAVRTPAGWRLTSGMWSRPGAAATTAPAPVATSRLDVPDELSVPAALLRDGDPALADVASRAQQKPWRTRLAAGVRADRVHGALAPDKQTGWLVANVELAGALQRAWLVMDADQLRAQDGALHFVLAHIAPLR